MSKTATGPFLPFHILKFGEDPFFYHLKPIFAPSKTCSWPCYNAVLASFQTRSGLSCTAHLSYLDTCHLQPNQWTTLDHHRSVDKWEVCIHGEEMLGTSLHDMSAPSRRSKRSDAIRKVRAQGAPHIKKKKRLNAPDERRGRGRGGETQSQPPAAKHSQG